MSATLLAVALDRVRIGWTLDRAFDEFLEAFFLAPTCEARLALLSEEPPLTDDPRLDALAGAGVEYLAKQHRVGRVPAWVGGSARCLDLPWHLCNPGDDGMREYLTFASPGEFRSHNIFTAERPLRWGRSGQPH